MPEAPIGIDISNDKDSLQKSEESIINELVERKLQPREEQDDGGFTRRVFTLNDKTFTFRGREETPFYPTLKQNAVEVLGEPPNWINPHTYGTYKQRLENPTDLAMFSQHYQVTKTPLGVIELALKLGGNKSVLLEMKQELLQRKYSSHTLDLIDKLLAANYVDDDGKFLPHANSYGDALVVLSLLGDEEATVIVNRKAEALSKLIPVNTYGEENSYTQRMEPLDPKELVVVHATRHEPKVGVSGAFAVQDTFDATNGKVLRNSVHTSFNHKVQGHEGGSWDDASYTLISPFEHMVKTNGVPASVNTVDTYWLRNPGEPLYFGQANLIAPDTTGQPELVRTEGNMRFYKSGNLGRQDFVAFISKFPDLKNDFTYELGNKISEICFSANQDSWNGRKLYESLTMQLFQATGWLQTDEAADVMTEWLIQGDSSAELEDRFLKLLEVSGATGAVKGDSKNNDQIIGDLTKVMADSVRSVLQTQITQYAVDETIRERGFEVQKGGKRAWNNDNNDIQVKQYKLAKEYGTRSGMHEQTPQDQMTKAFQHQVSLTLGEGDFDWKKYSGDYDDLIPMLDAKSRRVLYASGVTTAR